MQRYLLILSIIFSLTSCGQTSTDKKNSNSEPIITLTKEQKMDTNYFWKIMDYSFDIAKFDNALKQQTILDQLTKLTPQQIVDFEIIFQQMIDKSNTWNNIAAQTIIEGGSSDDIFYYFRCWLISLGKNNFYETLKNPDYLANINIPINKEYGYGEDQFEELIPLSDKAYSIVTKKKNEDESFPRAYAQKKGLYFDSGGETKGIQWSDKDLHLLAPKLYKKFKVK